MSKEFEKIVTKTKQREYKGIPNAVKEISGRTVTTLFSVAGTVDSYGDKMWPGAFAQTFAQRGTKILHLWQHDFESPAIAVIKSLRELPREEVPPEILERHPEILGAAEAVSDFLETPRADEVLKGLMAGVPYQASFGYDAIRYDFEDINGERIRNLREVRLWEVSTVLWGAEENTLGSKAFMPIDLLLKQIEAYITELKAGARHSASDTKHLNAIHAAVIELGCTTCKGIVEPETEADKSRAEVAGPSLTQLYASLKQFELGVMGL